MPQQMLADPQDLRLEWLVQEIQAEGAQRVHHGQELETVGGVAVFRDSEFRVPGPLVVGLFQNGAHSKLGGICDEQRGQ